MIEFILGLILGALAMRYKQPLTDWGVALVAYVQRWWSAKK